MGIKKFNPYTPSRRHMTSSDFAEITTATPEKSLLVSLNKNAGRNNQGKITVRHHGGGSRRKYRVIDFKRRKDGIPATVKSVEYDPNRTANIALVCYADGEKAYILAPNGLQVGQTLKVSSSEKEIIPADYLVYKVKNGDNLSKIAKEYDTTVSTIMKINNLNSDKLAINQQLLLPKTKKTDGEKTYTVKSGDTLSQIAYDNKITTSELKKANNLASDLLKIGQVLIIPSKSTGEINYIVQKGDNLYTIANKYDTTISDIKKINNLSTNTLQIGQLLKIPGSINYNTYIVKKGDSLWKIANKYDTTVKKIMTINNLSTPTLKIGQSLLIPTN